MSTTEAEVDETEEIAPDVVREAVAKAFADELGDAFIEQHIANGKDLWIRIDRSAWVAAATFAKSRLGMVWIDFISAIDWLPSPFGREMEAEQDWVVHGREEPVAEAQETGVAGGDTRFQMMMRLFSPEENMGVTIKADLPDDDLAIDTLLPVFPGANWHEREVWEMFGIHINDHPDLRALYLPSGFEGNPLRKDYPLVARRVKPWPGIVDVEAMPEQDEPEVDEATEAADAPAEAGAPAESEDDKAAALAARLAALKKKRD
jgi:NADH-quinone oxidoreductase subunit C